MNLKLNRHASGKDSTGGHMDMNGAHFCYTCEDQYQVEKVMHETCIPEGRYQIKLRDAGGMTKLYSKAYPFHRGMLHLQDVPGFEWIYIHVGNDDDDTSGCILVGQGIKTVNSESRIVSGTSVPAYTELYNLILLAMERGEEVWIEVG